MERTLSEYALSQNPSGNFFHRLLCMPLRAVQPEFCSSFGRREVLRKKQARLRTASGPFWDTCSGHANLTSECFCREIFLYKNKLISVSPLFGSDLLL